MLHSVLLHIHIFFFSYGHFQNTNKPITIWGTLPFYENKKEKKRYCSHVLTCEKNHEKSDRYYNEIQGGTVGINFFHILKSRYLNSWRRKSLCLSEDMNQDIPLQPVPHDAWSELYQCKSLWEASSLTEGFLGKISLIKNYQTLMSD